MKKSLSLGVLSVSIFISSCSKQDEMDLTKSPSRKSETIYEYDETYSPVSKSQANNAIAGFISDCGDEEVSDMTVEDAIWFIEATANYTNAYNPDIFDFPARYVETTVDLSTYTSGGQKIAESSSIVSEVNSLLASIEDELDEGEILYALNLHRAIEVSSSVLSVEAVIVIIPGTTIVNNFTWNSTDDREMAYAQDCHTSASKFLSGAAFFNRKLIQRKQNNFYLQTYNSNDLLYHHSIVGKGGVSSIYGYPVTLADDKLPGQSNCNITAFNGYGSVMPSECFDYTQMDALEEDVLSEINASRPSGAWEWFSHEMYFDGPGGGPIPSPVTWYFEHALYGIPVSR